MKFLLLIASTLCLGQAFAAPSHSMGTDVLECVESVMNDVGTAGEGMVAWVEDFRATRERLQAQKQRCEDLPRSGMIVFFLK